MRIVREPIPFPQETVTRQDAVRRQLSTAIDLILGNGDAVSANVLTWAATEVLRGVATARGINTFLGSLEDRIKPQHLKDWRNILREHYNYFKHSDRDPDLVITDFTPEATTWPLLGACRDYFEIYKSRTWPMLVYQLWFFCRNPNMLIDEGSGLVSTMSPRLGDPAGKPLGDSVRGAFEMLDNGRKHPELLDGLGPNWLASIERN